MLQLLRFLMNMQGLLRDRGYPKMRIEHALTMVVVS